MSINLTRERVPANCAFTTQHDTPDVAQTAAPPCTAGLGIPNGGLQVVNPSNATYDKIVAQLAGSAPSNYDFADQSLLGDLFAGRWVAIPYIYNALKTLRWEGVHDAIWQDDKVKNVHYIFSPKPWDEYTEGAKQSKDASHAWWFQLNDERIMEGKKGLVN